jgi:hypothetical protein
MGEGQKQCVCVCWRGVLQANKTRICVEVKFSLCGGVLLSGITEG